MPAIVSTDILTSSQPACLAERLADYAALPLGGRDRGAALVAVVPGFGRMRLAKTTTRRGPSKRPLVVPVRPLPG